METLFSPQNALRALAPEYKWAGMGNLLGDYGEYVATQEYGWEKAPAGSNGFDAITPEGKTVQIKSKRMGNPLYHTADGPVTLRLQRNALARVRRALWSYARRCVQQCR